ncbi:putative quinol monooxygenase [Nocardia alni]|uniref:putative quinol monooxygenase n=1 Tax=Nocardia alni TaxID=2815723 RepID=UPI001C24E029|nr:antibiotic biosynthesis monooxygenase [Nocardia alni]
MPEDLTEEGTPETVTDHVQPTSAPRDRHGFCVIVHGRARADRIEAAQRVLLEIVGPIRANPDCGEFRIFQGKHDPHSFTLVERWTGREAVAANMKLVYTTKFNVVRDEIFERLDVDFGHEIEPPETTF